MATHVGSIDQGTSSTRFCILDKNGALVAQHQVEHEQVYPVPGHVEHKPLEIWENTQACIAAALKKANLKPKNLASIGITNQRETTVIWNKETGKPYYNAIVWNSSCTRELASSFAARLGGQYAVQSVTGLPIASYLLCDTWPAR